MIGDWNCEGNLNWLVKKGQSEINKVWWKSSKVHVNEVVGGTNENEGQVLDLIGPGKLWAGDAFYS